MDLKKIFSVEKPIIGMIHFPPLIGYPDYPGIKKIEKRVLGEVEILNKGGVHSIMIENNYDIPHHEFVSPEITAMMAKLADLVVRNTNLPVGIDVLWNDFKSALGICAASGLSYFRVPAFVDSVRTVYGDMPARSKEVVSCRKKLGLENIAIFADVQVKHSEMVDPKKPLSLSVAQAFDSFAGAIIVTGKWTGDSPKVDDLKVARQTAGERPIIVGSGSTAENLKTLFEYTDGIIVGTAIMTDGVVDEKKLKIYMDSYKRVFS